MPPENLGVGLNWKGHSIIILFIWLRTGPTPEFRRQKITMKHYTQEIIEKANKLMSDPRNFTFEEIAREIGCSPSTIHR